jgi:hypothetical protein
VTPRPAKVRIYHITHVDNLESIVRDGELLPDSRIARQGGPRATIGLSDIKRRRLTLPVKCHAGDCVGDYVPFYFCPRSVMLYVIHRRNHPELTYRDGQEPIVHLEADLDAVIRWATRAGRRWAFTLSNAGAAYAHFRSSESALDELSWAAIDANDWRSPEVQEAKQAEFLVRDGFPWALVGRIGVRTTQVATHVESVLANASHGPPVQVRREWYY